MTEKKEHLTNLNLQTLQQKLVELEEPAFRFKQMVQWLYQKRVDDFDAMRNITNRLRDALREKYTLEKLVVRTVLESQQGDAVKFAFEVGENRDIIESVLLIDGKRRSLCVSSQLGCNLGCVFCATGAMGFVRNLTQHEIVGQLIAANDFLAKRGDKLVTNIIFMGMGEALSNYATFIDVLAIVMHGDCFDIGGRRITVSTAGVVPSIEKLIKQDLNINLAVSLNAYNDEKRSAIMPINNTYPIKTLLNAARQYYKSTGSLVTFEYVLICQENDTDEAAYALKKLLQNIPCKVNIIPLNPITAVSLKSSETERLNRFAKILAEDGQYVTVRKSRGRDISGACGQLAGRKGVVS